MFLHKNNNISPFEFSSPSVDLSLACFLETRLFTFGASGISLEQFEILERSSSVHIESLNRLRQSWSHSLALARKSATLHLDIHVNQTGVAGDNQGFQNSESLRRQMEILIHWLSIHGNSTRSRLYTNLSTRQFTLAKAISVSFSVNFRNTGLLGQLSSNIKQIDAVILEEVIWIVHSLVSHSDHGIVVILFSHFRDVRPQVMFKVGVLLHGVEQRNFLVFFLRQGLNRVISSFILKLDMLHDVQASDVLFRIHISHLAEIVEVSGLKRVKLSDKVLFPVVVFRAKVLLRSLHLLQKVVLHREFVPNVGLRIQSDFI